MKIRQIAVETLCDQLGIDEEDVGDDLEMWEMGCDDLDMVEMIIDLEERFSVSIPDEDDATNCNLTFEQWFMKLSRYAP